MFCRFSFHRKDNEMKEMSIDLETYSDVNITKCGAYKYAESDEFEILLFGVSVDGGPVVVYDLACGDSIPDEILAALSDENVTKWAFNASFERVCLSNWLKKHRPEYFTGYSIPEDPAGQYLDPASWKCSMIWSAYMGLPLSLVTSVRHVNPPKQTAVAPGTFRSMILRNGNSLRNTISVMWKSRWRYRNVCQNILSRNLSGMSTISIRRSMTEA